MGLNNLVQVGDGTWIDPSTVTGVKHWPPRPSYVTDGGMSPDNTVISHSDGKYTITYWPFERVKMVLGLQDRTWIYELWERG